MSCATDIVHRSERLAVFAAAIFTLAALTGCKQCKVTPEALDIDAGNNGVLEPGETVDVTPAWLYKSYSGGHCISCPMSAGESFHAVDFAGPGGATYTIVADSASYVIPFNTTGNCWSGGHCYVFSVSDPATRPAAHWDTTFSEQSGAPALDLGWLNPMRGLVPEEADAACSILTSAPKTWTIHIGESFTDVPTTHPFYRFIETLFHHEVTAGCSNAAYCPGDSIRRYQMAVFLLKGLKGADYQPPGCTGVFSDVPCPGLFTDWVEAVAQQGIISACYAGHFCPNLNVTRSDMAEFLLKAAEGGSYEPPAAVGIFEDVPATDPRAPWIEDLYRRHITAGCSSDPLMYCPDSANNRGQMAVFIDKTFGLQLYGP